MFFFQSPVRPQSSYIYSVHLNNVLTKSHEPHIINQTGLPFWTAATVRRVSLAAQLLIVLGNVWTRCTICSRFRAAADQHYRCHWGAHQQHWCWHHDHSLCGSIYVCCCRSEHCQVVYMLSVNELTDWSAACLVRNWLWMHIADLQHRF